jgi:hypothetical protein
MVNVEYCPEYWLLYEIYDRLMQSVEDGHPVDPKAIERATAACRKHLNECKECKR